MSTETNNLGRFESSFTGRSSFNGGQNSPANLDKFGNPNNKFENSVTGMMMSKTLDSNPESALKREVLINKMQDLIAEIGMPEPDAGRIAAVAEITGKSPSSNFIKNIWGSLKNNTEIANFVRSSKNLLLKTGGAVLRGLESAAKNLGNQFDTAFKPKQVESVEDVKVIPTPSPEPAPQAQTTAQFLPKVPSAPIPTFTPLPSTSPSLPSYARKIDNKPSKVENTHNVNSLKTSEKVVELSLPIFQKSLERKERIELQKVENLKYVLDTLVESEYSNADNILGVFPFEGKILEIGYNKNQFGYYFKTPSYNNLQVEISRVFSKEETNLMLNQVEPEGIESLAQNIRQQIKDIQIKDLTQETQSLQNELGEVQKQSEEFQTALQSLQTLQEGNNNLKLEGVIQQTEKDLEESKSKVETLTAQIQEKQTQINQLQPEIVGVKSQNTDSFQDGLKTVAVEVVNSKETLNKLKSAQATPPNIEEIQNIEVSSEDLENLSKVFSINYLSGFKKATEVIKKQAIAIIMPIIKDFVEANMDKIEKNSFTGRVDESVFLGRISVEEINQIANEFSIKAKNLEAVV